MFDRPTSKELIEAVYLFLEERIKKELPKHLAFNIQISINILKIVMRELDKGESLTEETKQILINILGDSKKATIKNLAKEISQGKIDLNNKKLKEVLIEITKKKLSVDNPNYSTYKKLLK